MLTIYCDGACEPTNPGGTAAWGIVVKVGRDVKHRAHGIVGNGPGMTNNVAEYAALYEGLKWLWRYQKDKPEQNHATGTQIFMDSKLVVNQVGGSWRCKAEHLKRWRDACAKGIGMCNVAKLEWIPREKNAEADAECRKAYSVSTWDMGRRTHAR